MSANDFRGWPVRSVRLQKIADHRAEAQPRDRGSRALIAPTKARVVQCFGGDAISVPRLALSRRLRCGNRLPLVPAQCLEESPSEISSAEGFGWSGRNDSGRILSDRELRLRLDQPFF